MKENREERKGTKIMGLALEEKMMGNIISPSSIDFTEEQKRAFNSQFLTLEEHLKMDIEGGK